MAWRYIPALLIGAVLAAAAGPPSLEVDKDKTLGGDGAPVTLEVFSSFDCPACRDLHEQLIPVIVTNYVRRGKVYLVSHESPMRPASRQAAIYATAAARIGRYQVVADALYKAQSAWTKDGRIWETVAAVLTPAERQKVQALAMDPDVSAEVDRDRRFSEGFPALPAIIVTSGGKSGRIDGVPNLFLFRHFLDTLAP